MIGHHATPLLAQMLPAMHKMQAGDLSRRKVKSGAVLISKYHALLKELEATKEPGRQQEIRKEMDALVRRSGISPNISIFYAMPVRGSVAGSFLLSFLLFLCRAVSTLTRLRVSRGRIRYLTSHHKIS